MLRQCYLEVGCEYGSHTWIVTYLFLSFSSDSINTVCLSWNIKVFWKISQFGRASAFFLVIFGKLLRACFIVPGPAKLKIVRVRLVRNDVSVPFASCPSNRRHSEYYSCQTEIGAYSNTKAFIRNVSLRFYAKSKFCVCFEVHIPVLEKFSSCERASYFKSWLEGTLCVYPLNKSEMVYCNTGVKILQ